MSNYRSLLNKYLTYMRRIYMETNQIRYKFYEI